MLPDSPRLWVRDFRQPLVQPALQTIEHAVSSMRALALSGRPHQRSPPQRCGQ